MRFFKYLISISVVGLVTSCSLTRKHSSQPPPHSSPGKNGNKASTHSEDSVVCENPGETILNTLEGVKSAFAEIEGSGTEGSGTTLPSKFEWRTRVLDGRRVIVVNSLVFLAKFDEASGKVFLKRNLSSVESEGELVPFRTRFETSPDEGHCSTSGFRFKATIGGNQEGGSYYSPIY